MVPEEVLTGEKNYENRSIATKSIKHDTNLARLARAGTERKWEAEAMPMRLFQAALPSQGYRINNQLTTR